MNIGWNDINIPFCKVGTEQYQQMNNIRETVWNTRQQKHKAPQCFVKEVFEFFCFASDHNLLKNEDR